MPSAFEPCGLGQMFAMRYGTVPVVRQTGGLADTVKEGETGFVFTERTAEEFGDATARAIAAFRDPDTWQKLVHTCMTQDFSWHDAGLLLVIQRASLRSDVRGRRGAPFKCAYGAPGERDVVSRRSPRGAPAIRR